ncbi:HesB/YadR/YfhF family protein [Lapidilactobacillus luobeiensis]|uniref:HesB/YadR/YfhF family protein n=1 Tax=Lapidilactobacillus luobeiensis TaxID=2950371 RepID=UPI0021C3245D|nr:iron-sulfur cluster biosynthesis protein [Lapidilactobacillus luobeiensis]
MKITIDDRSAAWFKDEFTIASGQGIHLFGKVYGKTTIHDGFSVGVELAPLTNVRDRLQQDDLVLFTENEDDWFFADHDLSIKFNADLQEPEYFFAE